MPILPDVRQYYNTNVQARPVDESGSMQYKALSNVSQQMGEVATQVARDLHVKQASIEAGSKLEEYNTANTQLYESLRNDPNLDFINNSKQIEEQVANSIKSRKQKLLDEAGSYTAKSLMEQRLAGSEAREAIDWLNIKSKRLEQEFINYEDKMNENLSAKTSTPYTSYNDADMEYMKTVNNYSTVASGNRDITKLRDNITKSADTAAINSTRLMLYHNRHNEAFNEYFGDKAIALQKLAIINSTKNENGLAGLAIKSPQEGVFSIIQNDGTVLDYKTDVDTWNKNIAVIPKGLIGNNEDIKISPMSNKKMFKDQSDRGRQEVINMLFSAIERKPKEDNSIWKRQLSNIRSSAEEGNTKYIDTLKNTQALDATMPSNLHKVDALDLITSAANAQVMEQAKVARGSYNLTEQKNLNEWFKEGYVDKALDSVMRSGAVNNALSLLGDGDINKGYQLARQEMSSLDNKEKLYKNILNTINSDIQKFTDDPIGHSQEVKSFAKEDTELLNKTFALGGFKSLMTYNADELNKLNNVLRERKATARNALGGVTPISEILSKQEAASTKAAWDKAFQSGNDVHQIIQSLSTLDSDIVADIALQLEKPEILFLSLIKDDPSMIEQISSASKGFSANIDVIKTKKKDFEYKVDIEEKLNGNKDFKNMVEAISRGDKTQGKEIAKAMGKTVGMLALQFAANGEDISDAVDSAVKRMVTDRFDIIKSKHGLISNKAPIILKKGSGIDEKAYINTVDSMFSDPSFWKHRANLVIPNKVGEANLKSDGLALDNFSSLIASTATLKPSSDGKYFDVTYQDTTEAGSPWRQVLVQDSNGKSRPLRYSLQDIKQFTTGYNKAPTNRLDSIFGAGVDKVKLTKAMGNGGVTSHSYDYINNVSQGDLAHTKLFEGSNQDNYNKIINGSLYGGLKLAALQQVDKQVFKKTPKRTLEEYRESFKTQAIADNYMKAYLSDTRKRLHEAFDLDKFNDSARAILTDFAFAEGVEGTVKSGLAKLLLDKNAAAANNLIMSRDNYKNKMRREWMNYHLKNL